MYKYMLRYNKTLRYKKTWLFLCLKIHIKAFVLTLLPENNLLRSLCSIVSADRF